MQRLRWGGLYWWPVVRHGQSGAFLVWPLAAPRQLNSETLDRFTYATGALRRVRVELIQVGEFLPGLEDDGFDRLLVLPFLHHAADIDRHELKIGGQRFTVSSYPFSLVAEPHQLSLDDAIGGRLVVAAFNRILEGTRSRPSLVEVS